ncbi:MULTISPECIES: ABC transporter substrate-binding protein [Paracoccus]|uniref:Iron-siderophore ABC transporter substrate-binding protein n=1 Tax=Paracoccus haeundaensis TaxID=225362 RepID=A0A5C4R8V5_9RHOB|nr:MULTISPECIES: ABC transporter substrate-binding protein [Paracoccus]KIX17888.1 amino acid ABC transporter substrate-binding protein [Paracoccus sp. 228]TNH40328.1 iron-siderophore ABC transporter substrate-binding protein [Paracoccus haeundaensis]
MVGRGAISPRPDRRAFLTAAGILLAAGLPLRAEAGPRLAAIDWAMLETATALGHMPVAAAELIRFRADVGVPAIPDTVTDLGLRGAPNFELLQLVRPTLILSSPYYTRYQARMEAIAPVLSLPFYQPGAAPLPKAMDALDALARQIGDPAAGGRARARANAHLDLLASRVARHADRPLALVDIGDARHLRAFGFDSLFGSTLTRIGLRNAWSEATAFSFLAPVPLERLADMPDARLIIAGPIPPQAQGALSRSRLWQALPQVAQGRVHHLPRMNAFGGVPAALRFGDLLARALEA